MKSFWNKRRKIYAILVLISAFIVFFLGWTFDKEQMNRKLSFGWDSITNFRKGLDVSGGTKLTYRIAYDNYEETYKDKPAELDSLKQMVENIIVKNIDGRISQLGVSDYKSYTQKLDNETQIVVEIGGVPDLDQAKELIGKTVELEFKLPNNEEGTEEDKAARTTIAQKLYDDLLTNTDKFEAIAANRESENVYYNEYSGVSLSQLPAIYQENLSVLNETKEGEISPLMEGLYYSYQDYSGVVQDINGYTFFLMEGKETGDRDNVALNDVLEVATSLGATYDEKFTLVKDSTNVEAGKYVVENGILNYNNGEVYPGEIAYDARIIALIDTTEGEDNTVFIQEVNDAKSVLLADSESEIANASPVHDGVISASDLKTAMPEFDVNNVSEVQSYDVDGFTYVVVIRDTKSATAHWFNFVVVNGVEESAFAEALESQTFYTLKEVFVQDQLSWINAQSEDGQILNGANFKYASIGTSQLGEPVVVINFDETGKEIFCSITSNNIGKQMAIFIGGEMITSPVIQAKICDGSAQIDGGFDAESAKELTSQLNAGALPAPLILMQEEKISASLGENALTGALIALAVGFIVIWAYMTYLYGWKKGFISLISLSIYTLVLFAFVKLIDYALSLSGIAAIILSVGMAVDANVLIFERMKEEKAAGKSDGEAINVAYDRSWSAIRDGQISTAMIGLLLMLMGINMFKGFGTMLVVAVLLTLLINVPVIKELLHIFYRKK